MGNLVKTVELRILASAGDAQRQLDEVAGKADELDAKDIKMRFRLEDGRAREQMDEIRAKADRLGLKDVAIKVRVDGAGRAIAELMAVRHEAEKARGGGLFSRIGGLFSALGGIASAGPGLPEGVPLIGGMGPAGLAAVVSGAGAALVEVTGLVSGFAAAGAGAGAFAALAIPAVKGVMSAYQGLNKAHAAYQQAQAKEAMDPTKANARALAAAKLNLELAGQAIGKLPGTEQKAVDGIYQLTSAFGKMSRAFEPQAFSVFASGLKVINNLLPHLTPFADTFAKGLNGLLQQLGKFTQSKGFGDWLKQFHSLEGPAVQAIGHGIGQVANSIGKLLTSMSGKDVAHSLNVAFGAISGAISTITAVVKVAMRSWDVMSADAAKAGHAIAGAAKSMASGVTGAVSTVISAWLSMVHGIESGVSAAVHAVSSLPGKIRGFFAGAAGWLVSAGRDIIMGLVHGIEGAIGAAVGAVEHAAGAVIGAAKSVLGIFSPSRKFHQIGQQVIQGLILGLEGGQGAVTAAMQAIGNVVAGPDSAISGAIGKLKGLVSGSKAPYDQKLLLTAILDADNKRLQALAAKRKMLEQEIADAEQVAQSEISNASVMNAQQAAEAGPSAPSDPSLLVSGMQAQAAQLKAFAAAIRELRREGLNATSLSQIVQAGAASGLPVAQGLLGGGKGAIAQINALEKQIRQSAGKLGDSAAPAMYAAGQEAGQGLASGLKSQLGKITAVMRDLARQLVAEIKRELHIKSPSLVMRQLGQSSGQGFELGLLDRVPAVARAGGQMAAAAAGGASGRGGYGRGGGDLHIHLHGVVDKQGAAREIHQLLREYKRTGGHAALGLG